MTPDPRLVELVDSVQRELPDWTPPALPDGDATALLDSLAVERLRGVLKLAPSWPVNLRDQTYDAIVGVIHAIENDGDRSAAWSARSAADKAAFWEAWSAAARAALWSARAAAVGSAAWSARAAVDAGVASSSVDAGAAYSAAWQREADRITTAIKEQS